MMFNSSRNTGANNNNQQPNALNGSAAHCLSMETTKSHKPKPNKIYIVDPIDHFDIDTKPYSK